MEPPPLARPEVQTSPALTVQLTVREGPGAGTRYLITRFPAIVGRGSDSDIKLEDDPDDPKLSRRHLVITLESGRLMVQDLSTNGTWVDRRQVARERPEVVADGAAIWLGPRIMVTLEIMNPQRPPVMSTSQELPPLPNPAEMGTIPLEVRAFGRFTVSLNERPIAESAWPTRKAVVLLVLLADQAPRPVAADRLCTVLWPDDEGSRAALQTTVSRIRKAFKTLGDKTDPVHLERNGYTLNPELRVRFDVREFERAADAAQQALQDQQSEKALISLENAVSLYSGDFLEGYTEDWVVTRRLSLEARYQDVSLQLARQYEAAQRWPAAMRLYRTLLDRDPCHEPGHLGLMRILVALGRREDAVRQYQEAVRLLKKTLNLAPGPDLLAFYHTVLQS